jgi:hypothetical protein
MIIRGVSACLKLHQIASTAAGDECTPEGWHEVADEIRHTQFGVAGYSKAMSDATGLRRRWLSALRKRRGSHPDLMSIEVVHKTSCTHIGLYGAAAGPLSQWWFGLAERRCRPQMPSTSADQPSLAPIAYRSGATTEGTKGCKHLCKSIFRV